MTAKEFVRSKHPHARPEKYNTNGPFKSAYYLIWSSPASPKLRLGEGETESKAWTDAKKGLMQPTTA